MKINVIKYKKVKSTNDTAFKLIKKNFTKPTLVTTEKQTNGRGRVGKKWISKKGNLFISLFFKFDQKKINFKQFAILNAFLLKKALSKTIPKNFEWHSIGSNKEVIPSFTKKIINHIEELY